MSKWFKLSMLQARVKQKMITDASSKIPFFKQRSKFFSNSEAFHVFFFLISIGITFIDVDTMLKVIVEIFKS